MGRALQGAKRQRTLVKDSEWAAALKKVLDLTCDVSSLRAELVGPPGDAGGVFDFSATFYEYTNILQRTNIYEYTNIGGRRLGSARGCGGGWGRDGFSRC
jgi:hypothetical protein